MPRTARITPGGYAYHVLNRGVGRMDLFDDEDDYLAFVNVLGQGLERHPEARLLGYCLMPNHWHLVFWPRRGADRVLSDLMRWVGTTHVRRRHAHRHSAGTGSVYQGRFKCFPIQADDHFLTVCRYVERNALRAKLVKQAQDWRWGSPWLRKQRSGLTPEERVLKSQLSVWPVDRPRNWSAIVNKPQTQAELDAIRLSVERGKPFGGKPWLTRTVNRLGLETTLRGRGRPRLDE